jgi:hypothetical protein
MTDYYFLLSRAVQELDRNTVEDRCLLYERVRKVMKEQLHQQAPTAGELADHGAALEEAIKRVEGDEERRELRLQTQRVPEVVRGQADEEIRSRPHSNAGSAPRQAEAAQSEKVLNSPRLPTDENTLFIPCENVRQELGGRLTLIGAAPGGELFLPADAPVVQLVSVAFLFVFRDGEGTFPSSFSLTAPSGKNLVDGFKLSDTIKRPDECFNLIVHIAPFQTTESGEFRAAARLGSKDYVRTFRLRRSAPS